MGSIGIPVDRDTDTHQFVLDYLRDNLNAGVRIIDHNRHATGNGRYTYNWAYVLYAAVENTAGEATAFVILYQREYRDGSSMIHIKALHEDDGPAEHEGVTKRLLAKLTDTDHEHAVEWRAKAHQWHTDRLAARKAAEVAVGSVIRLPRPYSYGAEIGDVQVVKVISAKLFRPATINDGIPTIDSGYLLRAPKGWAATAFEILQAAAS